MQTTNDFHTCYSLIVYTMIKAAKELDQWDFEQVFDKLLLLVDLTSKDFYQGDYSN